MASQAPSSDGASGKDVVFSTGGEEKLSSASGEATRCDYSLTAPLYDSPSYTLRRGVDWSRGGGVCRLDPLKMVLARNWL